MRLEQLELERPKYNEMELKVWNWTKLRIFLVFLSQLVVSVMIFLPDIPFNTVLLVQSSSVLFVFVFTFHEYMGASVNRLRLMRQLHRYEYDRHFWSLLNL